MAKYLFVYHGGSVPETEEAIQQVLEAWNGWLGGLGDAAIDPGNPVGQSHTVHPDGATTPDGGTNPASGYGIFEATDMDKALAIAKGCPILEGGGSVEVAEIHEM